MIVAVLRACRRLNNRHTIVILLLAIASEFLISHYGNGWRSLYLHTFLGGEPNGITQFGVLDYAHALWRGLNDLSHSRLPVFSLVWLLAFGLLKQDMRQILSVCAIYSAVRFLIYPSYEARYFGVLSVVTAIGAVLATKELYRNRHLLRDIQLRTGRYSGREASVASKLRGLVVLTSAKSNSTTCWFTTRAAL